MKQLAILSMLVALAACAQSPDKIAPAYVSAVPYQNFTCSQLEQEVANLTVALSEAGQVQQQARTHDTIGIILIGLPLSSMTGGNVAPEIARLKGEMEAVREASNEKQCGLDIPEVEFVAAEHASNQPYTPCEAFEDADAQCQ